MKTLTVDAQKRVQIPDAIPQQVFAYERAGDGTVILTPVVPVERKPARLIQQGGRSYLVSDQPITTEDVKRALEDFP